MTDTGNPSLKLELLRWGLGQASDAIVITDHEYKVMEWPDKARHAFGWSAEQTVGRSLCEMIIPERTRARHEQALKHCLNTHRDKMLGQRIRINAVHKDRREIPVELVMNVLDIEGEAYFCFAIRDSVHQLISGNSLKQQTALLNLSRDSIVVCDLDHKILFWNEGARRLYGYTSEEAIGRTAHRLLRSVYPKPLHKIKQTLRKAGHWEGEIFQQGRDGRRIVVLSRWALDADTWGEPARILISNTDISDTKQYQHHIQFLATHDVLTELPNRTLLEDRLQHAIEKANRNHESLAILSLALNRFKSVNDSLGHEMGNLLLREIAQRLVQAVGQDNTVARLGGAEFVICLERITGPEDARDIAGQILLAVSQPAQVAEHDIFLSASVGISLYPRDGTDKATLLRAADIAMHQAKKFGAGVFRFYSPAMNAQVQQRLQTENDLHRAVERKEFIVHYQPRFSVHGKNLVGLEALIRWRHPEKGLIYPAEFVPLAEEIGLISEIGEWMLMAACRQNMRWQKTGLPKMRISVNLSPRQLGASSLHHVVAKVLAETKMDARWLELEVTESGLMENIETAQQTLEEIRKLGVLISIDDFGTGYSSLAHLKKLPIDALKIDKSFISDLGKDPDDAAIVTATIAMAKSMDLKVVAEGVETQEQVDFLANLQCDELQGFYFSEALSVSKLEKAIRARGWFEHSVVMP
jgi:diguanylate cyclase (GGDEF)-like protein/PAS domain S-box-containing protein